MIIPLTKAKVAIVDEADYSVLSRMSWYAIMNGRKWYARCDRREAGKRTPIYMHRFIMTTPTEVEIDHVNGDGLDNRRSNLRVCSRSQNLMNMIKLGERLGGKTTSRFKGVWWDRRVRKWRAGIVLRGKSVSLGYFDSEEAAAQAYDAAAHRYFDGFARLNFPRLLSHVVDRSNQSPRPVAVGTHR